MTISYSLELPTQRVDAEAEFVSADAIADVARAAEASGFSAVHVTDHPAPRRQVGSTTVATMHSTRSSHCRSLRQRRRTSSS